MRKAHPLTHQEVARGRRAAQAPRVQEVKAAEETPHPPLPADTQLHSVPESQSSASATGRGRRHDGVHSRSCGLSLCRARTAASWQRSVYRTRPSSAAWGPRVLWFQKQRQLPLFATRPKCEINACAPLPLQTNVNLVTSVPKLHNTRRHVCALCVSSNCPHWEQLYWHTYANTSKRRERARNAPPLSSPQPRPPHHCPRHSGRCLGTGRPASVLRGPGAPGLFPPSSSAASP